VFTINEVPVLFISKYLFEIFVLIRLIFYSHTIWYHVCFKRNHCYSEKLFLLRYQSYLRHLVASLFLINLPRILLRLEKIGLHGIENRNSSNIVGQNSTVHNLISLFWHDYKIVPNFSMNNSSLRLWLDHYTIL